MGGRSSRMSFFRGVKVRVDEKWTWGEGGGQKRPKMGGRPLYTVPMSRKTHYCQYVCRAGPVSRQLTKRLTDRNQKQITEGGKLHQLLYIFVIKEENCKPHMHARYLLRNIIILQKCTEGSKKKYYVSIRKVLGA